MCLSTVTWQAKSLSNTRSKDKWQVGYKVFTVDGDEIYFPLYGMSNIDKKVELWKIYKCNTIHSYNLIFTGKNYMMRSTSRDLYLPGFHIFPIPIAAKLFTPIHIEYYRNIFEVKYRKVSAVGTHAVYTRYPVDCIIAREMQVIRCLSVQEIEEIMKNEEKIYRKDRIR